MVRVHETLTKKLTNSPAQAKLREYGLEQILADLEDGVSLRSIATRIGVGVSRLSDWLHGTGGMPQAQDLPGQVSGQAQAEQSARVYAAMKAGAEAHEALALEQLNIRSDVLENPAVAGALVSLAKERAQAHWRMASVRDPARFSDRRTGDTFIDARKQLQNLTIVSVPTTPGGGMRGTPPTINAEVGVLPSHSVELITDLSSAEVSARAQVPVPDFENSGNWGET